SARVEVGQGRGGSLAGLLPGPRAVPPGAHRRAEGERRRGDQALPGGPGQGTADRASRRGREPAGRARVEVTRRRALALSCLGASLTGGCAGLTVRSPDAADEHAHRAGAVQLRWRTELHQHGLFEPTPEECASGAVTGGKLVIGSRAGSTVAVDTEHGHIEWATQASGGIDSQARYDAAHDQVYVGSDDGTLFAVEPGQGKVRWSYHAKGAIERPPEVGGDMVYLATAADKVFALEAATGKWRWQYDRETPEGFTIHGYAGPRVFDPAAGAKAAAAGD